MIRAVIERFAQMPSALREKARWVRLGASGVPTLLVRPTRRERPGPVVIWMHGRTVDKETDPGRYSRWLRAGVGACAVDLPGHGERSRPDAHRPRPGHGLEIVRQMQAEIDEVVQGLEGLGWFDLERMGLGGMSLGGMAALARLCRPHPFRCASVEATSGAWGHLRRRGLGQEEIAALEPIKHLDAWGEIPLQAIHSRLDELVPIEEQTAFIGALRKRYRDPGLIELVEYDRTGAPQEHVGFGRMAADAKNRQCDFFKRWL